MQDKNCCGTKAVVGDQIGEVPVSEADMKWKRPSPNSKVTSPSKHSQSYIW